MRVVLQRVTHARVTVASEELARIDRGLVALVGVADGDTAEDASRLACKTTRLRLFADGERPFHRSVAEVGGAVMVVSQFTLLGDVRRGNRPSFAAAARPEEAAPLVDAYADAIGETGVPVVRGRFGANMSVVLENDGPVTLLLDSDALLSPRSGGGT